MFEIRCDKSTDEVAKIQKVARKYKAYLETTDEDSEDIWFCMSEIDGDVDDDEIENAIAEVTSAYDKI